MKTKILSSEHIDAMVKAMQEAGLPVESSETGYWVKHKGKEIFRAMIGSQGDYLVRHVGDLFA